MINLAKPPGNDNPRRPIGNAPETIKVPDGDGQASRYLLSLALSIWPTQCPAAPGTRVPGLWARLTTIAAAFRTTGVITAAWLAGLPRRLGRHWYAMNDEEARWQHWQVTEVLCGLGRQYRDPRFDALRTQPTIQPDHRGCPQSGGEGLCRPDVRTDPTTPA